MIYELINLQATMRTVKYKLKLTYAATWLAAFSALITGPALADPRLSSYGTPGLIEMPTAEVMPEGQLGITYSQFANTSKTTLFFQALPRLYGAFRYSKIDNYLANPLPGIGRATFDRSFDIHFQIADETTLRPAIAVGLRDFLGTGIFSSEYLVATKSIGSSLKVTAGLGWGRLGTRDSMSNPLGFLGDRFDSRPAIDTGQGGEVNTNVWFRGDVAPFAGIAWSATDQLTFSAEYNSEYFAQSTGRGATTFDSPFTLGVNYKSKNGWSVAGYANGDQEVGAQFSFDFNPKVPNFNAGREGEGPALAPKLNFAAQSWNLPSGSRDPQKPMDLKTALEAQGLHLDAVYYEDSVVFVHIENQRWLKQAQAVGRASRVLARLTPPEVESFDITLQQKNLPITSIRIRRQDLYELENDLDATWRSYTRASIKDAPIAQPPGAVPDARKFNYSFAPYFRFSFFDPNEPVRYEVGPQVTLDYKPFAGLSFSTNLRYPLTGTIDEATRTSDSVLPRVRSETVRYAKESDFEVTRLTAEYMFRPGKDLFGRVTAGYLEWMYAGISGELLWAPIDSRLALGMEVNYAQKRDYDVLFGLQDYSIVTGHASAYYDFGNGFHGQVDAGRYLAGDWGATFALKREFNSGIRVGGFFTLTDVPFDDFGEGSFDKGITIEIPLNWVTGQPTRNRVGTVIRPITRDGGARLEVSNRLYEYIREARSQELRDGWGRFYR